MAEAEFLLKIPEILSIENWIETRGQIVDGLFDFFLQGK